MTNEERIKQGNISNNLCFLLTDMMETSLMNAETYFGRAGFKLAFSDRQNFNAAIKAIRGIKRNVNACQIKTQMDFGDSSDMLYQFILMLVDRTQDDPELMFKLYNYVSLFPSKVGVEMDSSVFLNSEPK